MARVTEEPRDDAPCERKGEAPATGGFAPRYSYPRAARFARRGRGASTIGGNAAPHEDDGASRPAQREAVARASTAHGEHQPGADAWRIEGVLR